MNPVLVEVEKNIKDVMAGKFYKGMQPILSQKAYGILFCILSAVLLALSFSRFNLGNLSWFGFIPLFLGIENKSKRGAFLLSYLTGIIFWIGTIYWLIHVTLAGLILLALYLGLYFGFFGLSISSCNPKSTINLLSIPCFWVILEYIRGHLLTGFPWAILGYTQYKNLPIIQIADITGVYGVSFLIVMVNVAIYYIIRIRKIHILPLICLIISLSYGFYRLSSPLVAYDNNLVKVAAIQGNIPQELKWNPKIKDKIIAKYFQLTRAALEKKVDLVIWPETAVQDYLVIEKGKYINVKKLEGFVDKVNIPFLLGMVTFDTGNDYGYNSYYNSAVLLSQDAEVLDRYDKLHLVPFGEYIPLRKTFFFLEELVPIDDFSAGKDYTVFSLDRDRKTHFSALICFEDIFPDLARKLVKKGAGFLINITNDAWFMDTSEPYQHLAASVLRAVENRVSVVRSANTGVSCFISPSGKIKSKVSDKVGKDTFVDGFVTDSIIIKQEESIYTRYGDMFVLLCFIITVCRLIVRFKPQGA